MKIYTAFSGIKKVFLKDLNCYKNKDYNTAVKDRRRIFCV